MYTLLAKFLSIPRVFNYLLNKARKTPYSHIYGAEDGGLYMERYWLFNPYKRGQHHADGWFPISIRLHKIVEPDNDRHLHDHPWNARTFILRGWYREERLDGEYLRVRGDTTPLSFGQYHRIKEVSSQGVYTLFVTGKYQGTWGFLVDGIKVSYKKYLGEG